MRNLFLMLALSFGPIYIINGQISQGGRPLSFQKNFTKSSPMPVVTLPSINISELREEDAMEASKDIPLRFAYGHDVQLNPNNSGKWYTMSNGDTFWMLHVESKGARSLNFTFSDFYLPQGTKLFIYNKEKSDIKGAFTALNNKTSRKLGTTPVLGDNVIIEYYQPASVREKASLQISTIAHDYKGVYSLVKSFEDSGACNINAHCDQGDPWKDQIRSIALISLDNGTRLCTGALINNTNNDRTPYLLTANHCLTSEVDSWVFNFNYESPDCTNSNAPLNQSISGSELLASGAGSDFALLKLSAIPPTSYNVYFAGWDATGNQPLNSTGIHHPRGDIKKISIDNDRAETGTFSNVPSSHWRVVDWDIGTTEVGSSGSPLFDQNKRIVGQLHGGGAACGNNNSDFYGKLDKSFPSLEGWLAPDSDTDVIDGYDPLDTNDCEEISLTIKLDNYPEETSWIIRTSSGKEVYSGTAYENNINESTVATFECLPQGCYIFEMYDDYGDGLCCGYGNGSYELNDINGVLAAGGIFGSVDQKEFCVGINRASAKDRIGASGTSRPLDNLKLVKNPVNNLLEVTYKIKKGSTVTMSIIDITGKVITTKFFDDNADIRDMQFDVQRLPQGTYFLNAMENGNSSTKKFIVAR